MTRLISFSRLSLALILICATITGSSTSRLRRHVGTEESSHRSVKEHASSDRGTTNNEITAEPGRKVSHRLVGGHLRVDTRHRDGGESLWDDGILMSAAGNGKEGKSPRNNGDDEDEKKTLSQQVKEGKYGLIQNEIYGERPKRPGIISYLGNPEVPRDTADNLGGLDEEEIWLAENHVLVLRGGNFPEHEQDGQQQQSSDSPQPEWPPIDDYKAPKRQVKIPTRPKVPPPFPVQLADGESIRIIGPNGTTEEIGNGTLDYSTDPLYTKGLLPGEGPFFAITPNGTIFTPDPGPPRNFSVEEKSIRGNKDQDKGVRPEQLPGVLPPFYHAIPPGAVFVAPPSNQSDYDEEDQSIYYPPPYSFYYPQDNTTAVPPGPLVPGIILPPPPDFFSALDDKKTITKKYTKRPPTTTTSPRPTYLPPRKFTTKQYKASSVLPTSIIKTTSSSSVSTKVSFGRVTSRNASDTFAPKQKTVPKVEITTRTSGKPHTLENTEIYTINSVNGNQVSEATTQQKDWSTLVTSKVPVLAYYPSTTQSSLKLVRPVEVTPASIKSIITTSQPDRSRNHASYYFYEESTDDNSAKSSPVYYETTTKSPYYDAEKSQPRQTEQKKHYYTVETIATDEIPKDYKTKIIDSIVKNSQTFQYTDSSEVSSSKFNTNLPQDQSQHMLADEAPVYYQPVPAHPLQTYYTTPKSPRYYHQTTKAKPIYQYSFQVADYSKRGDNPRSPYHSREQQDVYNEYQDVKSSNQQYDYEDIDLPTRQQQKRIPTYKTQHPVVYSTSTAYPILETTSNPQHAYFTPQDEKLLDDVTKEYFTIFGKKLSDSKIASTTPIYGKSSSITEKPEHAYVSSNIYKNERPVTYKTPNVKVHYGDQSHRPYSLKDDTLVNYQRPLPPINPDSEFIETIEPKRQPKQPSPLASYELRTDNYRLQNQGVQQHGPTSRYLVQNTIQPSNRNTNNFLPLSESREEFEDIQEPVSLLDDIKVNYRNPRPAINPDAEFIDPASLQDNHSGNPNAYFAYRLPGDVGHFYFLTPRAITQRPEQNGGYVYPKSRGPRLLRQRRRQANV
ncbi:uncharacterized protein LOC114935757 [Nylanderia fulva]|uniref:uncharacterized protein LOC114935757 n=1 Tax=Nylanderia fulva TaxID=613905 RepID=UPI0010FBB7B7|nr:uncharacterized protein LOC114935757 [Nylanderia fulva]XP_029164488.1 uncharacterized protein LOC114935757 [Nylanderia fulva]